MPTVDVKILEDAEPVKVKIPNMGYIKGNDGFSPTVTVEDIPGGHRITITDAIGPHSFDVLDETSFIAEYGTTTKEELDAAYEAGKLILVKDVIPFGVYVFYRLIRYIGGEYTFAMLSPFSWEDESRIYVCAFSSTRGWEKKEIDLAKPSYFVSITQGKENAGKFLAVGDDGRVTLVTGGGGGDTGGLIVEDEQGNTWHFLAGAGDDGDIVIEDEEGNLWHAPAGAGAEGDIPIEDGDGGTWHIVSGSGDSGGGGGSLPDGGTDGQYLVKDSTAPGGARWADLPTWEPTESAWSVTPLVGAATTLNTAGNYLDRDVVVQAIPYAEVSNQKGGKTATIGG